MKISDAEFHRILVLAVTGWDETYGKKPLAELHSQGVLGERGRLLALMSEIETKQQEPQQGSEPHAAGKKAGNVRQTEEE